MANLYCGSHLVTDLEDSRGFAVAKLPDYIFTLTPGPLYEILNRSFLRVVDLKSCIPIPFQIQRRRRSSSPTRPNMTADTLRVATLSSLNYMLSTFRLNLKPRLDIDDFEDPLHSVSYLKLMVHQ